MEGTLPKLKYGCVGRAGGHGVSGILFQSVPMVPDVQRLVLTLQSRIACTQPTKEALAEGKNDKIYATF